MTRKRKPGGGRKPSGNPRASRCGIMLTGQAADLWQAANPEIRAKIRKILILELLDQHLKDT